MAHTKTEPYEENLPSYFQLVNDTAWALNAYLEQWKNVNIATWPGDFLQAISSVAEFSRKELGIIILLCVIWTLLRYLVSATIFRPLAQWLQLKKADAQKFPESVWKLLFYSCTWSYTCYVLFWCGQFDYFQKSLHIWSDWKPAQEIMPRVYWMYMIQLSFYFHSVYGTLYMDKWRKDSLVMIFHHILTISLIGFSYATRYHKIGTLVLFMHDITDIFLEFTKCNVYLKTRGGKKYPLNDHISTVGFLGFAAAWVLFRLYWFPLKVLHSSLYGTVVYGPNQMPCIFFFNVLLWILQCLNIYWFWFIVHFLYKVATGQMSEVDDIREEEVEEKYTRKSGPIDKSGGDHESNGSFTPRKSKRKQAKSD